MWNGGARCSGALLPLVNLLLMMLAGAGLATAARLKWDSSASIPLRMLLPCEYRVLAALLTACPLALLLLAVLACAGLASKTRRRSMLLAYAVGMGMLMIAEVVMGIWLAVRIYQFLTKDPIIPEMLNLLYVADVVLTTINGIFQKINNIEDYLPFAKTLLGTSLSDLTSKFIKNILSEKSPRVTELLYSEDFVKLLREIPADLPCNIYVGAACALLCAVLQPLGALLALLAARRALRPAPCAANPKDNDFTLLSYVKSIGKVFSITQYLRPKSIADVPRNPTILRMEKETALKPRGWRQEPCSGGWTRG